VPPVAVEMTYTVRDRNGTETPYTSILRYVEYVQTRKDGDQQVPTGQWATKPTHMLEKCVEADVYRKAFPQDFSGVQLDDAMPPPDPDAPDPQPERQRVTAAAARERRQTVTAVATVVTPDASPAQPAIPPADAAPPPARGAGEAFPPDPTASGASSSAHAPASGSRPRTGAPSPSTSGGSARTPEIRMGSDSPGTVTDPQIRAIWSVMTGVFKFARDEKDEVRDVCARIAGHDLPTTTMLSFNEARSILDRLDAIRREAADAAANPREYLELMTAPQDAQDGDGGE
jgi:RecT family protein